MVKTERRKASKV